MLNFNTKYNQNYKFLMYFGTKEYRLGLDTKQIDIIKTKIKFYYGDPLNGANRYEVGASTNSSNLSHVSKIMILI